MRRGQERYLHHLVGCLPAATLIVRDGRIEASNQRAAELLGVAHRAGLVGQRADSVISGIEEATRLDDRMEIALRTGDDTLKHIIISCSNLDKTGHIIVGLEDVTELRTTTNELEKLAAYDPLTGLPNRRFTLDLLQQTIDRNRRAGRPSAVLFVDLDGFKIINDTLGHETGDNLLRQAARVFRGATRANEQVGRLGGDEFVVVIDGDTHAAQLTAQRILQALREPIRIGPTRSASINASIGVASDEFQAVNASELLSAADHAMYAAKKNGRGQAIVASGDFTITQV